MTTGDYINTSVAVISSASLVLSVLAILFTLNWNKKATTLHLHQIWASEEMRAARTRAYHDIKRLTENGEVLHSSFSKDELGAKLSMVEHFFADLRHLFETSSLDKKLARRLFGRTTEVWFNDVFKKIKYGSDAHGNFYEKEVLPLEALLKGHSVKRMQVGNLQILPSITVEIRREKQMKTEQPSEIV